MQMFSILLSLISGNKKVSPSTTVNMHTKVKSANYCTNSNTYMVPSSIYHIYSGINNILSEELEQNIIEVSRKIVATSDLPKLQVVKNGGNWFTLNNAQLDLCRILEKDGKCSKVQVDIVSLSSVPRVVRGMMIISEDKHVDSTDGAQSSSSDPSRITVKGYEPLKQAELAEEQDRDHVTDSETDETCSESTDFADSDSECDWSDSDVESSEAESSGSDNDQSSDNERECLI